MDLNFTLPGVTDQEQFIEAGKQFTVDGLLQRTVTAHPDRRAVVYDDVEYTYAEMNARACKLANGLIELGYEPHSARVGFLCRNRPEVLEIYAAAAKAGFLVPALNWRVGERHITHCVDVADPDAVIVSDDQAEKKAWIDDRCETDPDFISLDGDDFDYAYEEVLAAGDPAQPEAADEIHPEQGLVVMYTSGTTGKPKGAIISHRAYTARAAQYTVDFDLAPGDGYVGWAPMFHMSGTDQIFLTFALGGTYFVTNGYEAEKIVEYLRQAPIGWFFCLPATLQPLIDYLEEHEVDPDEFAGISTIGGITDLANPEQLARVTELVDTPFQNLFGGTEFGVVGGRNTIPIGKAPMETADLSKEQMSFVDLKLVDEDWNEVPQGEPGEIAVRGTTLFSGYIDNAEANQDDFHDGWFRTGDLLVENERGLYDFVGRRKYMIRVGGENLYPSEIESVLQSHDLVTDASVISLPDDEWGQVPKAIVSTPSPEDLTTEELMGLLKAELARYKLPHYLEIIEEGSFPRSMTDKIDREALEEWPVDETQRVRDPLG